MKRTEHAEDEPQLLTVREAAEALRVSPRLVRDLIKAGRLDAVRFSERSTRVSSAGVARLLRGERDWTADGGERG